jgi:hypothetical protein
MKKVDLEKLVIAFLLGVCLMLAIGAGGEVSSGDVGTYQLSAGTNFSVYVLNTQTGQLWFVDGTGGNWQARGHASGAEAVVPMPTAVRDTRPGRISEASWNWSK